MLSNNFKKIGEDIYVYKNFLTKNECDELVLLAESFVEKDWVPANKENDSWHEYSPYIDNLDFIKERLEKSISEDLKVNPAASIIRMKPGWSWGEHSDNHQYLDILERAKLLKENEPYKIEKNSIYGVVLYLNSFKGGQIYYANQNIEYAPEPGDLVVQSALEHCRHGVKKVESKIRYSFSLNIYQDIKVPAE